MKGMEEDDAVEPLLPKKFSIPRINGYFLIITF
jgi:hypothetical protein